METGPARLGERARIGVLIDLNGRMLDAEFDHSDRMMRGIRVVRSEWKSYGNRPGTPRRARTNRRSVRSEWSNARCRIRPFRSDDERHSSRSKRVEKLWKPARHA